MTNAIFSSAITVVMLVYPIIGNGQSQDSLSNQQAAVTADQAFALALKYAGFSRLAGFSATKQPHSELVTITDDQTPFLHEKIDGRLIQRVRFDNVVLPGEVQDTSSGGTHLRKFEVLLDPVTGQLFKIISKSDVNDTNIAPEPGREHAEKQLTEMGEMYHGFPDSICPIDLRTALNICPRNPAYAKEISALLVLCSRRNLTGYEQPKPFWIITLRGIPPVIFPPGPRNAPPVPLYQRNYVRQVIDAATGHLLFWTTIPTVEPRK